MMDIEQIDDDGLLPIFAHDHPEVQVMRWSNTELRAIKDYAKRCISANDKSISDELTSLRQYNAQLEKSNNYLIRKLDLNVLVNDHLREEIISLRQYKAEAESQEIDGVVCNGKWYTDKEVAEIFEGVGCHVDQKYAHPVPAGSCAVPEGWHEEWEKNVRRLYLCARKHDMSIPDDQLDFMRNYLLSAIPSNSEGEKS